MLKLPLQRRHFKAKTIFMSKSKTLTHFFENFFLVCYVNGLENLKMEELKFFAKLRNIGGYKNMFRQQLESIFTTSFGSPPRPKTQTPVP